jgi:Tol biopolymer transport system component
VSTIPTGLSKTGIGVLAAVAVLTAATACSGGGSSKPAAPAERHLIYIGGEPEATASATAAKAEVWIADPNGAHPRKLTKGFVGLISPDGRNVAVQRQGKGIFVVSSDGQRTKRLTAAPQLRPQAWSPDGKKVYVTATKGQAVVELAALDVDTGSKKTIARGSLYGLDTEPGGKHIVYSRAPQATDLGICGDQFDLYVANLDGSDAKAITHDGLSAFPVWGRQGIAFMHFPGAASQDDCGSPGIWTSDDDGSNAKAVIDRAPESITLLGFYGLQPIAWMDDSHLLIGLRGEDGLQGAVLDTHSKRIRQLNRFVDEGSTDGLYAVGGATESINAITIIRLSDNKALYQRKDFCCPDWNR